MLNLRRGPGAYALLSRADGQLTRAGQHYYSHLGLRPPSKDFDYNQPLIREGPNDYILLRNGQKKTKLGKGFFRDKYYEYLVHVPVIIRGRRRSGRNAGGLRGTQRTSRRSRWRSGSGNKWRPRWTRAAPSCSSETYFFDVEGHWVVSTQSTHYRNSGDAPAPAHEGPEERELPAALRGGRAAERLRGQAALRAPAAGRAAAAERGGGVRRL